MKTKKLITIALVISLVAVFSGCTNIVEEDPNSQQTPWAGPASWENQMPGMPNQGF